MMLDNNANTVRRQVRAFKLTLAVAALNVNMLPVIRHRGSGGKFALQGLGLVQLVFALLLVSLLTNSISCLK